MVECAVSDHLPVDTSLLTASTQSPSFDCKGASFALWKCSWEGWLAPGCSAGWAFYTGTNVSRIIGFYVSLGDHSAHVISSFALETDTKKQELGKFTDIGHRGKQRPWISFRNTSCSVDFISRILGLGSVLIYSLDYHMWDAPENLLKVLLLNVFNQYIPLYMRINYISE